MTSRGLSRLVYFFFRTTKNELPSFLFISTSFTPFDQLSSKEDPIVENTHSLSSFF